VEFNVASMSQLSFLSLSNDRQKVLLLDDIHFG
jgi:hypothetical protein